MHRDPNRNTSTNPPMNIHRRILTKSLILAEIKKIGGVTTTSEIANIFKVSWNTAEKKLLEMTIDGDLNRMKKAGVNLWTLKFK